MAVAVFQCPLVKCYCQWWCILLWLTVFHILVILRYPTYTSNGETPVAEKGLDSARDEHLCIDNNLTESKGTTASHAIDLTREPPSIEAIEADNPSVLSGGRWAPIGCSAREKLLIIVPYKDRPAHLRHLLIHLHPFLQRQQRDYRIAVVEQANDDLFNKGRLMNTAAVEMTRLDPWDCVIFHDVDLIPEVDLNLYKCSNQPVHLSPAVNELRYMLMYSNLVGGVLALTKEQLHRVNGYSNSYWGWGGEDDDMAHRILNSGLKIHRPASHIGRYKMVRHVKRKAASNRIDLLQDHQRWTEDGLNSLRDLKLKLLSIQDHHLYTNISLDVGRPKAVAGHAQEATFSLAYVWKELKNVLDSWLLSRKEEY